MPLVQIFCVKVFAWIINGDSNPRGSNCDIIDFSTSRCDGGGDLMNNVMMYFWYINFKHKHVLLELPIHVESSLCLIRFIQNIQINLRIFIILKIHSFLHLFRIWHPVSYEESYVFINFTDLPGYVQCFFFNRKTIFNKQLTFWLWIIDSSALGYMLKKFFAFSSLT